MSYILEALKKLEQKRQREQMPDLLTFQGDIAQVNKKKPRWPLIAAGLILFNAILVFLLLWFSPLTNLFQPPQHQTRANLETAAPAPSTVVEKNKDEPAIQIKKDEPLPEKKDAIHPKLSRPQPPVQKKTTPEQSPAKSANVQLPPPVKTIDEAFPKAIKPLQPTGKILSIKELPADVKASLPELKMTVHSFNNQKQTRFVVINNNIFREGQSINLDLKVEQISQNGVIFNYKGHLFLLQINENL